MPRIKQTLALLTLLAIGACSDAVSPNRPVTSKGIHLDTYSSLDAEINGLIEGLFPTTGLVTAAGDRWDNVKAALAAGKTDVARKQVTNLSTWVSQKSMASRKNEASRLILDMALYVYNGALTPIPAPGVVLQTAAGVVEPTTALTLTTSHFDGSLGDGGIHIDVGSVSTTTIAVISEVVGDFTQDCSGPLNYSGCQQPKFFRITLFPHDKLLKNGQVQICHVNQGAVRRPLGDHDDLRVAHEKPASSSLYTEGSTIVDGIEILPFNPTINFLTLTSPEGECQTAYDETPVIGFVDHMFGRDSRMSRFVKAVGGALTPKSAYAIDQGGGGEFKSESIFGLVNSKILLSDGCITGCPNPILAANGVEAVEGGTKYKFTVTNYKDYPDKIFTAASEYSCGENAGSARTLVEMHDAGEGDVLQSFCSFTAAQDLSDVYFIATGRFLPQSVYLTLTDRETRKVFSSNSVVVTPPTPPAGPTITNLTLSSSDMTIGGASVPYTVVIDNPGNPLSGTDIQGWVDQANANGGNASRAAGGVVTLCGGVQGQLPTGTCTMNWSAGTDNTNAAGSGTLVAGPALFRLQLRQGSASTVLSQTSVPINLVAGPDGTLTIKF